MNRLDDLIKIVNKEFNVDISLSSRKFPIVWARIIYTILAYNTTNFTPKEILGRIDSKPSKIHYYRKQKRNLYGHDSRFTQKYDTIAKKIVSKKKYERPHSNVIFEKIEERLDKIKVGNRKDVRYIKKQLELLRTIKNDDSNKRT